MTDVRAGVAGDADAAGAGHPSAVALRAALAGSGVEADVEADGRLAVIVPRGMAGALMTATLRAALVAAARADGFTHCAVDLPPAA